MPDILAHTMIYRGGPIPRAEALPRYTPADEPAYRALYDDAFRPMRLALGLPQPACTAFPAEEPAHLMQKGAPARDV